MASELFIPLIGVFIVKSQGGLCGPCASDGTLLGVLVGKELSPEGLLSVEGDCHGGGRAHKAHWNDQHDLLKHLFRISLDDLPSPSVYTPRPKVEILWDRTGKKCNLCSMCESRSKEGCVYVVSLASQYSMLRG